MSCSHVESPAEELGFQTSKSKLLVLVQEPLGLYPSFHASDSLFPRSKGTRRDEYKLCRKEKGFLFAKQIIASEQLVIQPSTCWSPRINQGQKIFSLVPRVNFSGGNCLGAMLHLVPVVQQSGDPRAGRRAGEGRAPVPCGFPGISHGTQCVVAASLSQSQAPRRRRLVFGLLELVETAGELRGKEEKERRGLMSPPVRSTGRPPRLLTRLPSCLRRPAPQGCLCLRARASDFQYSSR